MEIPAVKTADRVTFKASGGTEDLASTDGSSESETSTRNTGRRRQNVLKNRRLLFRPMPMETDLYRCCRSHDDAVWWYNYTDENGNIIADGLC